MPPVTKKAITTIGMSTAAAMTPGEIDIVVETALVVALLTLTIVGEGVENTVVVARSVL